MKKVIRVMVVIVVLLVLAIAGFLGYMWYRDNHIFVEDAVYPISSQSLDLREQDISFEHYDSVHSQLPGCEILWNVPFQGGKVPNDTQSLTVSTLTQEDIDLMKTYFPALKAVDASAMTDYAILEALKEQLPQLAVSYQVDLGGSLHDPEVEVLELWKEDYTFDALVENLKYLPGVTSVKLRMPEISTEQVEQLKAAYEAVSFACTVELLDQEYETDVTELDLSAMTSEQVPMVVEKLPLLPNVAEVELRAIDGSSALTKADVKALMEAAPGVVFHYTFEYRGYTLSTADEEVHIKNQKIGEDGVDEVREILDIMTNCKRFVLEHCQISNETMAKLRDEYRDRTKIVWRVYFGKGSTLTDAEIIRAVYDLSDKNCKDLIYCEDARFLDLGHNGDDNNFLHDCSYVAGMPKLEACILSSAYISDLSAFANCKELKMLEIAFCGLVEDITPLANCEKLEMLNISFTGVTDLTPLDNLPMTHLCAMNYSDKRASQEDQDRFQQLHPDCWSQYVGSQPYGPGWRYTEDGKDYLDYYGMLRVLFKYDIYPRTPNHVGWYLEGSITDEAMEDYSDNVKAMCKALLTEEGE